MAGLLSKTYNPNIAANFQIGLATSSRSTCRNPDCKEKIKKGSIRIARMEVSPSDGHMTGRIVPKWVHLPCCDPVILQEAVNRYGGLVNIPGYDFLEEDYQSEALQIASSIITIEEAPPPQESKNEKNAIIAKNKSTKEKAPTAKKHKAKEVPKTHTSKKKKTNTK